MKALQKENLSEQISERLRDYIIENGLRPGDKLPTEAELMQIFGVSRSSVREAMKLLQVSGVIDVKPGRGAVVNSFDTSAAFDKLSWGLHLVSDNDIFLELLEARRLFESMVLPLVIERMDDEHLNELRCWLDKMKSSSAVEEYRDYDTMFHKTLIESVHNRPIAKMGEIILDFFEKVRELFPFRSGPFSSEEHEKIYKSCKERNLEELQRVVSVHLRRYEEWIKQKLMEDGNGNT